MFLVSLCLTLQVKFFEFLAKFHKPFGECNLAEFSCLLPVICIIGKVKAQWLYG